MDDPVYNPSLPAVPTAHRVGHLNVRPGWHFQIRSQASLLRSGFVIRRQDKSAIQTSAATCIFSCSILICFYKNVAQVKMEGQGRFVRCRYAPKDVLLTSVP